MFRRCFALALCLAWIPTAYAFPPCPLEPIDLIPVEGGASTPEGTTHPWFTAYYSLVGDPTVIGEILPAGDRPDSGKCREDDGLPVPDSNLSFGDVTLTPNYAPRSGFGIVALPDLRTMNAGLGVSYSLEFNVDTSLLASGDWFDVAQLEFQWAASDTSRYPDNLSSVYRVRKRQVDKSTLLLEIVEVRKAWNGGLYTRPPVFEEVVASIEMDRAAESTPIVLRWSQRNSPLHEEVYDPIPGFEEPVILTVASTEDGVLAPSTVSNANVDATLEVLGADGKAVYRRDMPGQWTSTLSMGLIDYNVGTTEAYVSGAGPLLTGMRLRAERSY